jgi:hypothetical protein
MSHGTPNTKLAAALSSAALALGALAPAAAAHYGSAGSATEAGVTASAPPPSTSAQDPSGSAWVYVGVGGALLSGGAIFTAARRKCRHFGGTGPPAASA